MDHAAPHTAACPMLKPANPCFSSGPCAKRPGWSLHALSTALLGRSHRAPGPKARIQDVSDRSRAILGIPADYLLGLVPASDTGAFEMAMWAMLGPKPVDILAFETFSKTWAADITKQLRLQHARTLEAPFGQLPDLAAIDPAHDLVLAWNGTTSGIRMPTAGPHAAGAFISDHRDGLVFADATSAAFAMHLPWPKLDVVTWSWQKVLGGEAAHGMIALSPRAVARLEAHTPAWPMPKIFRLASGGTLNAGIFNGDTINTPSLLCVEDAIDGLRWAQSIGGLDALVARSEANLAATAAWVATSPWAAFLAQDPVTRSCTAICLTIQAPWFQALDTKAQWSKIKQLTALLDDRAVAHDIAAHRDTGPGLRIWGGATVETTDLQALFPWLDWAFDQVTPA